MKELQCCLFYTIGIDAGKVKLQVRPTFPANGVPAGREDIVRSPVGLVPVSVGIGIDTGVCNGCKGRACSLVFSIRFYCRSTMGTTGSSSSRIVCIKRDLRRINTAYASVRYPEAFYCTIYRYQYICRGHLATLPGWVGQDGFYSFPAISTINIQVHRTPAVKSSTGVKPGKDSCDMPWIKPICMCPHEATAPLFFIVFICTGKRALSLFYIRGLLRRLCDHRLAGTFPEFFIPVPQSASGLIQWNRLAPLLMIVLDGVPMLSAVPAIISFVFFVLFNWYTRISFTEFTGIVAVINQNMTGSLAGFPPGICNG